MVKTSWIPIVHFLENLEPLKPIETELDEKLGRSGPIKACIFDIYGTLIISASGDIDKTAFSEKSIQQALEQANIQITSEPDTSTSSLYEYLLDEFRNSINKTHTKRKAQGTPYPEVDFTKIWEKVLKQAADKHMIVLSTESDIQIFTFLFELMNNKVYPMPDMLTTLQELRSRNIPIGIVSNAQFFTPILLNYFINEYVEEREEVEGFQSDLIQYSYKQHISKPDIRLFEKIRNQLVSNYHISADQTLYIGNDMLNDVYPAQKAGFQTALFAGDQRSLRLRENLPEIENVQPDFIIKDLKTIVKLVAS